MPSPRSVERSNSHDDVVDLLSEARRLVVRNRAGEEDNLVQIQQVIEAAQRELRLNRFRSSIENLRAITVQAGLSAEVDAVEESNLQEIEGHSNDGINGSTHDEEANIALLTASVDEEEDGVDLVISDVEDTDPGLPSLELFFIGLSGSPLVYTDLSRLQRSRSFVDFVDTRLRLTTSSNVPVLRSTLAMIPRDGDTWTRTPALGVEEEREVIENDDDPFSGGRSYTILSTVSPLPTPPRSPAATGHRDNTPVSSAGATAGSSVALEERQNEGGVKDQPPFTKERRAQLMAAMTADVGRYSQEREWALYQDQGYCVFPSVESPVPKIETHTNTGPTGSSRNSEETSTAVRTLRRIRRLRRESNRATPPIQPFERRPVNELPDPAEEFLIHLLNQAEMTGEQAARRQEEQGPQFEELRAETDRAQFRYSLLRGAMDGPPSGDDWTSFEQLLNLLAREETSPGNIGGGREELALVMLLTAQPDGMDIREAKAFGLEWHVWSNRSQELYPDVPRFLSLRYIEFWSALRQGWGTGIQARGCLAQ
jgi:hypothetical protein